MGQRDRDLSGTNQALHQILTSKKEIVLWSTYKTVIWFTLFLTCINFIVNISHIFETWNLNSTSELYMDDCSLEVSDPLKQGSPEQNPGQISILCTKGLSLDRTEEFQPLELSDRVKRDDRTRERGRRRENRFFTIPSSNRKTNQRRKQRARNNLTRKQRKPNHLTRDSLVQEDTKTENKILHMEVDNSREPIMKTGPQGSVMDFWKLADEGYNQKQDFAKFHIFNGTVSVLKAGFYFIYSQITYFDNTGRWSHVIDISNHTLVKCLTSEWGLEMNPDTKQYYNTVHQCYSARSSYIHQNQVLSIKSMYADRTIHADAEMSFWGLVKL